MAKEIEYKFLVDGCFLAGAISAERVTQGYLSVNPERTVRVRTTGLRGYLTVKGKSSDDGLERDEWEYPIPLKDAEEMLALPGVQSLCKMRYQVPHDQDVWEVDVFLGMNQGLVIAELEVPTRGNISLPSWVGEEVTGDIRYYNSQLVKNPFTKW